MIFSVVLLLPFPSGSKVAKIMGGTSRLGEDLLMKVVILNRLVGTSGFGGSFCPRTGAFRVLTTARGVP